MAVYLITYELRGQKQYPNLHEAIRRISGIWCQPVESAWFVKTDHSAHAIRDHLQGFIDVEATLFVAKMAPGDAAGVNLSDSAAAWLQEML